jgi:RNA:NAD 2'-phosphotransferase (TPT1/KptA family)
MADSSQAVSFRIPSSTIPFVVHVDEEGYAVVNECLLCLRFHLQENSLLVEREEFDGDGNLIRTVYQNPIVS